jgi:hypothetical protein
MAGEHRLGRAAAQIEGGGSRHRPVVDRVEIAPGRQDIEPAAAWCTRRSGINEAAGQAGEHRFDLAGTAGPDSRPDCRFDPVRDGSAGWSRWGSAAFDDAAGQCLEPLDGVAHRAPGTGVDGSEEGRAGPLPGVAHRCRERIEGKVEIMNESTQQRGIAGRSLPAREA